MSTHIAAYNIGGKAPKPEGNRFALAGIGAYETADGLLMLGAANMRQQKRLWEALGRPDMVKETHAERLESHAAEEAVLKEVFLARTADEWQDFLRQHQVPAGRIRTMQEALADPQLETRGLLQDTPAPLGREGSRRVPVAPFLMSEGNPSIERPAPVIGEHTDEVLAQAGFSADQIEALVRSGAASRM